MNQKFETTDAEEARTPLQPPAPALSEVAEPVIEESEDPIVISVRERMKRFRRRVWAGLLYIGIGTLSLTGILLLMTLEWRDSALPYMLALGALFLATSLSAILSPRKLLQQGRNEIKKLGESRDIQSIGTLIEMIRLEKEIGVADAKEGLIALLPQLRSEEASLLKSRHRVMLRGMLAKQIEHVLYRDAARPFTAASLANPAIKREVDLKLAIMEALAVAGAKEDLPLVESLAAWEAETDVQRALKAGAERCMPLLRSRIEELEDRNSLLRASNAPTDGAEVLLRPASATRDAPELLLRAEEKP